MGRKCTGLYLLMWKNFTIDRRTPIKSLFRILSPILYAGLLILFKYYTRTVMINQMPKMVFQPFAPTRQPFPNVTTIGWSPCNNPALEKIMQTVAQKISLQAVCFQNGTAMDKAILKETNDTYLAGVQFDDALANGTPLTKSMDVALRFPSYLRAVPFTMDSFLKMQTWETADMFPNKIQALGPRSPDRTVPNPNYDGQEFLLLQQEVSYAIIKHFQPNFNRSAHRIMLQRFPYPEWTEDIAYPLMSNFVGLLIITSMSLLYMNLINAIVVEKETQMKETLMIMGLPRWLLWITWFLKTFIYLAVTAVLIPIAFKVFDVLSLSNPLIIIIILLLYVTSLIAFAFTISTLFSKSTKAATFAGPTVALSCVPYWLLSSPNSPFILRILISLFPSSTLLYVFRIIMFLEAVPRQGLQWENMWDQTAPFNNDTVGFGMIMLMIDTILYMLLALYIEQIIPGEYGIAKKWYFPFAALDLRKKTRNKQLNLDVINRDRNEASFEPDPINLKAGIKIKNLQKTFGPNVAVNNLSLNMYENQITALLGHNGAGKTTTIMMLIGMYSPSDGTAYVDGYDIRDRMDEIRESLGICPQHNLLFDLLTVEQHLYFFCKLKGMSDARTSDEISKYLVSVQLEDKAKTLAKDLSGGMKRKLSVAAALCGDSKIIVCDEPSSGMDPSARRSLWDFLQEHKQGRTILLTTHFMDEADVLGDRIAIMANGKLQCCGSSFFLKKTFGTGYHLVIDKLPTCDVDKVTLLLQKYIPNINIEKNVGSEIIYMIRAEESRVFENMLGELEVRANALGVRNYGISLTTMEEVFMKVGTEDHSENSVLTSSYSGAYDTLVQRENSKSGNRCINQTLAMFLKRAVSWQRLWYVFLVILVGPTALNILSEYTKYNSQQFSPKLQINLSTYHSPLTLIGGEETTLRTTYVDVLGKEKYLNAGSTLADFTRNILDESEKSLYTYTYTYIVGAFFKSKKIVAFFNGQAYHSSPLALNLAMNAVLKTQTSSDHNINIYNYPLGYSKTLTGLEQFIDSGRQIVSIFGLIYISSFIITLHVFFYVKERVSGFKHMQFVCGANPIIFWTVPFICDLLLYGLSITLSVVIADHLQRVILHVPLMPKLVILFCYGVSIFPLLYLSSFVFRVPSANYSVLLFILFLAATASLIAMALFKFIFKDNKIEYLFMALPTYNCVEALIGVLEFYQQIKVDLNENIYSWHKPGIGKQLSNMCMFGIVLFILLILIEYRFIQRIIYRVSQLYTKAPPPPQGVEPDEDVIEEMRRVKNMDNAEIKENSLTLRNATKYFGKFVAVNQLSLAVKEHECFGLLGVNGAGKTTTFKMLTGDERISYGDAWIQGWNVKNQMKEAYKVMGYCPQFDAVLDDFTGWETMRIICLLRGIGYKNSTNVIQRLAQKFDFDHNLKKPTRSLSGGNKRKLSTAIAIIGDPQIIYLDEPTTGMDPGTKRYVWDVLIKLREEGKCIILTSHSMEECEALCTRLTIMVNGSFLCLGSKQRLKSKYSTGYTITIKMTAMQDIHMQSVKDYMMDKFNGAVLREEYEKLLTYYIPDATLPYSVMFGIMEQGKASLPIEDYSISQCSLEQVFLSFTKYQHGAST